MSNDNLNAVKAKCDVALAAHNNSRTLVQEALVAMVEHASKHGDKTGIASLAGDFVAALQGANRMALKAYLEKFCALEGGLDKGKIVFKPVKGKKVNLTGATANNWWSMKDDTKHVFGGFSLAEELIRLGKRMEKAQKEAKEQKAEDKLKIDEALLQDFLELKAQAVSASIH